MSIIRTGWPINEELIDLVNSVITSNDLTQMVKLPTWIPDCHSHSPALLDLLFLMLVFDLTYATPRTDARSAWLISMLEKLASFILAFFLNSFPMYFSLFCSFSCNSMSRVVVQSCREWRPIKKKRKP